MKSYIRPISERIAFETSPILEGSEYIGGSGETVEDKDQLADEYTPGRWEGIWDNMNASEQ